MLLWCSVICSKKVVIRLEIVGKVELKLWNKGCWNLIVVGFSCRNMEVDERKEYISSWPHLCQPRVFERREQ